MDQAEATNPFKSIASSSTSYRRLHETTRVEDSPVVTVRERASSWVTFEDDKEGRVSVLASDYGATSFSSSLMAAPLRTVQEAMLSNDCEVGSRVDRARSPNAIEVKEERSTPFSHPGVFWYTHPGVSQYVGRDPLRGDRALSPISSASASSDERRPNWERFDDDGLSPVLTPSSDDQSGDHHLSHVMRPGVQNGWQLKCKLRNAKRKDPWVPVNMSVEGTSLLLLRCPETELQAENKLHHPGELEEVDLNEVLPYQEIQLHHGMAFTDMSVRRMGKHSKSHSVKLRFYEYKEKRRIRTFFMRSQSKKSVTMLKLCSDDSYILQDCVDTVNRAIRQLPVSVSEDPSTVYHSNKVFVDVRECCKVEAKWDGRVIQQNAIDTIYVTAFISHTPECRLVVNDCQADKVQSTSGFLPLGRAICLNNVSIHPCVDKDAFDMNRSIIFHPLDAVKFQLLQCETSPVHQPPLKATVLYRVDNAVVTITATLEHSLLPSSDLCLTNVVMKFPIPELWASLFIRTTRMGRRSVKSTRHFGFRRSLGTDICQIQTNVGKAKYEAEFGAVVWRIGNMMSGHLPDMDNKPAFHCQLELLPGEFVCVAV